MDAGCGRCKKKMINFMREEWRQNKCECGNQRLACSSEACCVKLLDDCPNCNGNRLSREISIGSRRNWMDQRMREHYRRLIMKEFEAEKNILIANNQKMSEEKHKAVLEKNLSEIKMKEEFEDEKKNWMAETQKIVEENDKKWVEKTRASNCSECGNFVAEEQLLVCDCNEDAVYEGGDLRNFLSKAICGACALPHIVDHGNRIKKAQSVAITSAAEIYSRGVERKINDIFGSEWHNTVDKISDMKDIVGEKISHEHVKAILESSESIGDYNMREKHIQEILEKIENKVAEIMTATAKYRQDVENQLGNIYVSSSADDGANVAVEAVDSGTSLEVSSLVVSF